MVRGQDAVLKARGNPPLAIEDVQLQRKGWLKAVAGAASLASHHPTEKFIASKKSQCILNALLLTFQRRRRETTDAGGTCQITRYSQSFRVRLQIDPPASVRPHDRSSY